MATWKLIFLPFAWMYGLVIKLRHRLFDKGYLSSVSYPIPLIAVGNLSLGGTGKTPFIEYLIRLLEGKYKIATLSRGYGRKTSGFLIGNQFSGHQEVGDEPMQYIKKYSNKITVAVDENRRRGVEYLMENDPNLEIILLDDAFQHRYVKPGISILLTDIHKLYRKDHLVPAGTLRDVVTAAKRADIIVVTKTDRVFSPITKASVLELLKAEPHQKVFFSFIDYDRFVPFAETGKTDVPETISKIVLFTGIVNPAPLEEHLRFLCNELEIFRFPDHHVYTRKDLLKIKNAFENSFEKKKLIVTTEKDAMRLVNSPYLSELNYLPVFYVPVKLKIHGEDAAEFDKLILDYVKKNRRNSTIHSA